MRSSLRTISILLVAVFLAGTVLSSCRILRGDPRKNCNHPKHGEYMKEQQMKRTGFQ
ncbi:MAG: hypothetical protein AAFR61_23410 [Bacteroidota bacterium]